MAATSHITGLTVYLEGDDARRGNVLAEAYVNKVHRLLLVLHKLERAYLSSRERKTDFEITHAEKRNPTLLTIKQVPRVVAYDPTPAFVWGLEQMAAVARGDAPDPRVNADIASDLVKLATPETRHGYKAFWVNGQAESIRFDDRFLANATQLERQRTIEEAPTTRWHVGASIGSVVGKLQYVDDLEDNRTLIVEPPTGAEAVVCVFPPALRDRIGQHLFKMVRVVGKLHYEAESPFPTRVDVEDIEPYPKRAAKRSLADLRGVFAGVERSEIDWDRALNAR